MTQTRIRITDEMVDRAVEKYRDERDFCDGRVLLEIVLKAALGPHLERRKGERRDIKTSSSESTDTPLPTCNVPLAWPNGPLKHRRGREMLTWSQETGPLYLSTLGTWLPDKRYRANPSGFAVAGGGKPQATQDKPKTPPTIQVSQAMVDAGVVVLPALWSVAERAVSAVAIYRAMRLKEIEEQQNPDMGSR